MPPSPHPVPVTSDPDRGIAVNSASDPQRPGAPIRRPPADTAPPGASSEETSTPEPGPSAGPADVERDDDKSKAPSAVRSKVEG
jgi:hypothetical protein